MHREEMQEISQEPGSNGDTEPNKERLALVVFGLVLAGIGAAAWYTVKISGKP